MSVTGFGSAFTRILGHAYTTTAAFIVVVATVFSGTGSAQARAAQERAPVMDAAARFQQQRSRPPFLARRPFEHRRHERLFCRECHGTGEQHRTLLVRTPTDCARCHHDASRAGTSSCRDCHAPASLPESGTVAVALTLTVVDTVRPRELPFGHERHARLDCVSCHGTPVTLAPNRECGSCHAEHHSAEANCSSCHTTINRVVHPRHSHLSCAGSGCHSPAVAPKPALSRNLCLTCHPEQREHEPKGSCAACHGIPLTEP